MGNVVIRPFRASEAVAVSAWTYEAPYDIYDGDPRHEDDYLSVDPDGYGYYAIATGESDDVLGFCCFGAAARVAGQEPQAGILDIGGGVRPDHLGQGIATEIFPLIMEFARNGFTPTHFRTAIAAFNERSSRLCMSAGFEVIRRFEGPGREFLELQRPA